MSQTLDQQRAQYARQFIVEKWQGANPRPDDSSRLLTLVRNTPVQILQNGLGQTCAYLLADAARNASAKRTKEQQPSHCLYTFMQQWLCHTEATNNANSQAHKIYSGEGELIDQLTAGTRRDYLRAQEETLALLQWLKKFADAWLASAPETSAENESENEKTQAG